MEHRCRVESKSEFYTLKWWRDRACKSWIKDDTDYLVLSFQWWCDTFLVLSALTDFIIGYIHVNVHVSVCYSALYKYYCYLSLPIYWPYMPINYFCTRVLPDHDWFFCITCSYKVIKVINSLAVAERYITYL